MPAAIPADARLILHIGAPKTGSSAVQRYCCEHAADLRREGLHYPEHPLDANGVSGGHGELFALLLGGQAAAARRALACHLADARRAGCRLVLSAEGMLPHAGAVVAALPTDHFHVVCFVRHPLDAIASHHNQGIKRHFGTGPLAKAAAAILAGSFPNPSLSGEVLLDWLVHCGRARMAVLPYVVNGQPIDATAAFLELMGLLAPAGRAALVNRSYTPVAAAFKRLVNGLPEALLAAVDAPLDAALQAYSDARPEPRPMLEHLVDPAQHAALERHFRGSVERVEAAFGIQLECRRPAAPGSGAAADDTIEAVWRHVARDERLAGHLHDAVAGADPSAGQALGELVRIIGTR